MPLKGISEPRSQYKYELHFSTDAPDHLPSPLKKRNTLDIFTLPARPPPPPPAPPGCRLLQPGVFKPSCSTPFTLFLGLVSEGRPFQLYFIPKTLHDTSVFSSLLTAYSYLTGHYPVLIYNTALLYIVHAFCSHLQTQRVSRALHPVSGEDGILVASSARTSPRRVVGLSRPNQSAGRALP